MTMYVDSIDVAAHELESEVVSPELALVDPELGRACPCRKPEPGLILDAAADFDLDLARSWMVGDSDVDIEAGRRAGCRTILIEVPGSAHRRKGNVKPDYRVRTFREAADIIASLCSTS